MLQQPGWTPDKFREDVRERFFADSGSAAGEYVEDILLLEKLIVQDRICLFRSSGNVWGDMDGGEKVRMKPLEPGHLRRIRTIASRSADNGSLASMKTIAQAICDLADRL
jgi:hypothetical protein